MHKATVKKPTQGLSSKNYLTPNGFNMLQNELRDLVSAERPKVVETVRWAASNGDRSENGDYIYGKKRLREIDRRIRYLTKSLESATVINPTQQQGIQQIFFGATVTYKSKSGLLKTIQLVGVDEADLTQEKISWKSPVAKALLKARVGDKVTLNIPAGTDTLEVIDIEYKV